MRTLLLVVALAALPLGCSEDDPDEANDPATAGKGSGAAAGMGGKGNAGNEGGGEGGAQGGSDDHGAAARLELCQAVCETQAELDCPPDPEACLYGWCEQPVEFLPPQCMGAYDVMLGCMAEEPVSSFECDGDDKAVAKEEACAGEQAALVTCFQGG